MYTQSLDGGYAAPGLQTLTETENYGASFQMPLTERISLRAKQMTDYDKLGLEVWTNGAVSPQDAIGLAAKLIKDHMSIFINFEEEAIVEEQPVDASVERYNENLNRSVEELELSVRSYNCLKNANIQTIGDLVVRSESDMLKTKNFGRKSLNEIKEILGGMGLGLGMRFDDQGRLIAPEGGSEEEEL
jgi:DNA-directed RNA polymerase subunit alpha